MNKMIIHSINKEKISEEEGNLITSNNYYSNNLIINNDLIINPFIKWALINKKNYFIKFKDSDFDGFYKEINNKRYKLIHEIKFINDDPSIKEDIINNNYESIIILKKNNFKFFSLINNSLYLKHNYDGFISLLLDPKLIYDEDVWGRKFFFEKKDKLLLINYVKEKNNNKDYNLFIVLKGVESFEKGKWVSKKLIFDKKRGMKEERFYYEIKILSKELIISASDNKENALKELNKTIEYLRKINIKKKVQVFINDFQSIIKNYFSIEKNNLFLTKELLDYFYKENYDEKYNKDFIKLLLFTKEYLLKAINKLKEENNHYIAGLPWFFQTWARDELISNLLNKESTMDYWRRKIKPNDYNSKDFIGLLAFRTKSIFSKLNYEDFIILEKELSLINNDYLFKPTFCNKKETWMDSISREGINIEIEALKKSIFDLKKKFFQIDEKRFITNLRINTKKILLSGNSFEEKKGIIRPNSVLAFYFFKDLVNKKEWLYFINQLLKHNFLLWGGLSSVNKDSFLFKKNHTGINSLSYHNGDSWYFINNLFASMLIKIDFKKYYSIIKKIILASIKEFYLLGISGFSAELSSAENQESNGSLIQLWSMTTLKDLINDFLEYYSIN